MIDAKHLRARILAGAGAVIASMLACAPTAAQQPTSAQASAIRSACRSDYMANCAGVPTGGAAALACLQQNAAKTSPACQQALQAASGGAPAAKPAQSTPPPQSAAPAPAAPPAPDAGAWPHTVAGNNGIATIYQPQVISWPDRKTLNARIAMGITPTGAKAPVLGVIEVAFATQTDLAERTVVLTDPQLTSSRFPSLDTAQAAQFEDRSRRRSPIFHPSACHWPR